MATFDRMDSSVGGLGEERDHDTNDYDAEEEEEDDPIANLPSHGQQQQQQGGGGGDAMSLLASYYGLAGGGDEQIGDEIDRNDFQMEAYVHQLLECDGLETLLIKDDELVQEVKRLDSDMQMLVYENYSKFISATDTIRTMKNNVNDMKAEMDALVKNMEGIASRMQVVNSFLGGKRAKVDKLVSVRRLLKRLDFLFDLPINLNRYVQRQDFAMAVTCYAKAIDILRQHTHVPSFKSIQRESDQIIAGVRDELQRRLAQQADATAVATTPTQLAQYVHLLLELGVPKAELQTQVLKAYRGRFSKTLAGLSQGEEERRAKELAKGEEGAAAGAEAVEAALTRLDVAFLRDFEEAVVMFRGLFVTDSCNASSGSGKTAGAELLDLVRTLLMQQYLEIVKRLFKANLAMVARGPRGEDKQFPLTALEHFLHGSIRRLHKQAREAGVLEAGVALVQDVARGLIFLEFRGLQVTALQRMLALQQQQQQQQQQFAPREQLEGFQTTTARDLARAMETLQGVVQVAEEGVQDAIAEATSAAAAAAVASSPSSPTDSSSSGGFKRVGGASSSTSSSAYRKPLVPELGMGQYVFQFVTWLADAGERMAGVTFRLTENDVVEVGEARRRVFPERFFAHASSFSSLLDSEQVGTLTFPTHTTAAAALPQYALLLAVLCRDLQTTLWPQATATLALVFPAIMTSSAGGSGGGGSGGKNSGGYVGGGASSSSSGANKLSPEDVVVCLNGSAARLLQHCIEAQGHELALLFKTPAASSNDNSSSSSNSVGGVTQATWGKTMILRLEALVKELGAALGVSVLGVGLSGGRRGERADLSRTPGLLGGRKGVLVDIERIFTVKVQVFGQPVDLAVEPVLMAVLKAACKALIEWTRLTTLSRKGYCQLQVDVQLLRQAVGTYVRDASVLETLLEEVLISAGERTTVEALQGVDSSALSAVASTDYTRLSSSLGGAGREGGREGGFSSASPSVRR
jgi:hypothetical protein